MNELRKALQYLVDDLELRARISKDGEIACGDGAYQQAKAALAQPEQEPVAWAELWTLPETGDYVEVTYTRDKPELGAH